MTDPDLSQSSSGRCPCCGARVCVQCGAVLSVQARGDLCRDCYLHSPRTQRHNEEFWQRVLALRTQGLMNIEIAERLGCHQNAVATAVYQMRQRGIDVPTSPYYAARRDQNQRGYGPEHVVGRLPLSRDSGSDA